MNAIDPSGLVSVLLDYISAENKGNFSYNITEYKALWGLITYKKTIDVTFDGKTASYKYQDINGKPIIDSDWLVDDFGLECSKVEHQVGDVFKTVDDTALAWALKYYPLSNNKNDPREYGSVIYENDSGFSFGKPNVGSKASVGVPNAPTGHNMIAGIHTHPKIPGYAYNWFSRGKFSTDESWVSNTGFPLYLATPSGKLKVAKINRFNKFVPKTVFSGLKY